MGCGPSRVGGSPRHADVALDERPARPLRQQRGVVPVRPQPSAGLSGLPTKNPSSRLVRQEARFAAPEGSDSRSWPSGIGASRYSNSYSQPGGPPPFRSGLTKTESRGSKQYLLDNQPIGPAYPIKTASNTQESRVPITQKYASSIFERRNMSSPHVRKIKSEMTIPETQYRIEVRNNIARMVDRGPMAKHFVVEIFTGEKEGNYEYIAKRVNGFSLDDIAALNALVQSGKINKANLNAKLDELGAAMNTLNRSGYFHNDIQPGNIMYDYDTGALALIDFELADTKEMYGRQSERPQINALKNKFF